MINYLNAQLESVYSLCWDEDCTEMRFNQDLQQTNPYLLCVSDEYAQARYRIMYVGQETNTWGSEFEIDPTITDLMNLYNSFVNRTWGTNQLFWQFYSALRCLSNMLYIIYNI